MMKKLWTFVVVTLGTIACFVAFSSCAEDQDDFFKKHRQEILERDKEDAAIRQDLKSEIDQLRLEITQKISIVEESLNELINSQNDDVLSELESQGSTMRSNIDTRYNSFITFMDEKFGDEENAINNLFVKMGNLKTELEGQLKKAISDNNDEQKAKVQELIDQINASESLVNNGKQKMTDLINTYKDITDQADKLLELENRLKVADENISAMLENLSQTMQTYKENVLTATDTQLSELSNTELASYESKLKDAYDRYDTMLSYLDKLSDYQERIEKITDDYQFLANNAGELEDIANDVNDAWDDYSEAEEIIDLINELDISEYESLPSDYESALDDAMNTILEAESDLNSWLEDLVSFHDYLLEMHQSVYDDLGSIHECLEEMHSEFDAIPFP